MVVGTDAEWRLKEARQRSTTPRGGQTHGPQRQIGNFQSGRSIGCLPAESLVTVSQNNECDCGWSRMVLAKKKAYPNDVMTLFGSE